VYATIAYRLLLEDTDPEEIKKYVKVGSTGAAVGGGLGYSRGKIASLINNRRMTKWAGKKSILHRKIVKSTIKETNKKFPIASAISGALIGGGVATGGRYLRKNPNILNKKDGRD
jgi:hypothetical protein